jgi:hypothetical protein
MKKGSKGPKKGASRRKKSSDESEASSDESEELEEKSENSELYTYVATHLLKTKLPVSSVLGELLKYADTLGHTDGLPNELLEQEPELLMFWLQREFELGWEIFTCCSLYDSKKDQRT